MPREEQASPWTSSLQNWEQINKFVFFQWPGLGALQQVQWEKEADVPIGMKGLQQRVRGSHVRSLSLPWWTSAPLSLGPLLPQAGASLRERLPAGMNRNRQADP